MKEGATFINTARGAVIRELEMIEVLTARRPLCGPGCHRSRASVEGFTALRAPKRHLDPHCRLDGPGADGWASIWSMSAGAILRASPSLVDRPRAGQDASLKNSALGSYSDHLTAEVRLERRPRQSLQPRRNNPPSMCPLARSNGTATITRWDWMP